MSIIGSFLKTFALGGLNSLDELFTSDEERLKLAIDEKKIETQFKEKMINYVQAIQTGQMEINKTEALNNRLFIAGWRPATGWVCVLAFSYNFLFYPLFSNVFPLTSLDVSEITTILLGMLGLGGFRTFEKLKDVERNR